MKIFEVRSAVIVEVNLKDGQSLHLTKGKWTLPSDDPEVIRLVEKKMLFEVASKPVAVPATEKESETPASKDVAETAPVGDKPGIKNKKKAPKSPGAPVGDAKK